MCMHLEKRDSKYTQKEVIEETNPQSCTGTSVLPVVDRISRQQINKDIEEPNNAIKELDTIDICRTLHLITRECICFFGFKYIPCPAWAQSGF